MSRLPQREHGDFRSDIEPKSKAETHALVDVDVSALETIKAGGKAARLAPQCGPPHSRKMNLTAVCLAAQHQIASPAVETTAETV